MATLPDLIELSPAADGPNGAAEPAARAAPSILVVDDNAGKRLAIRTMLAPLGHPIVEADSGRSALRALLHETFAVILMDVRMPGMDGYETAELVRKRSSSEQTPIIFITSFSGDETETTAAYANGAVDFIFAPIAPVVLRAKVAGFVSRFEQSEKLQHALESITALNAELRLLNVDLERVARVDSLTGVRNRRDIEETLEAAIAADGRHRGGLAVLLIDIDHFKRVNDTLGHQVGDAVLLKTAQIIKSVLRIEDSVGRWGGEEFLVVLPQTDAEGALLVAHRLRAELAAVADGEDDARMTVTVTIGLAMWESGGIDALIERADAALYAGKAAGRDNVQMAPAAAPAS